MDQKVNKIIYFDNSATSWPKPDTVIRAMEKFLVECGANPGRSGHRLSIEAARIVFNARERIADLFNAPSPMNIVFTKNATEALNLILFGILREGDHVVTSSMEHNSVMRPLKVLENSGVTVAKVRCSSKGEIDPDDIARSLKQKTKLVILNHGSNVVGTLTPVEKIGKIVRNAGAYFCVDGAQTAGVCPVDMKLMNIDFFVFTGHKSLYGPQGTGGVCFGEEVSNLVKPLIFGGTGSSSGKDEQPDFLPDKFESGTLNVAGIAGLCAGIEYIESLGLEKIRLHETQLHQKMLDGLNIIPGIKIYGPMRPREQIAVISFNIDGFDCSDLASRLEEIAGICCRAGIHCAPYAHKTLGTFPEGTVRFSFGIFNNDQQIKTAIEALQEIAIRR